MLVSEARWLREVFAHLPNDAISPLLNLGSSTRAFREAVQPHIEREVFAPLRERAVQVLHCDLKADDGVDIAGDIFEEETVNRIALYAPRAILCANMFEHVADRAALSAALMRLLPPGGLLVVTVPYSYPYHPDPIDTLYRPAPRQLASLFPGWEVCNEAIVAEEGFGVRMMRDPLRAVRHVIRTLLPLPNFNSWISAVHRWSWLISKYRVTCVALRQQGQL